MGRPWRADAARVNVARLMGHTGARLVAWANGYYSDNGLLSMRFGSFDTHRIRYSITVTITYRNRSVTVTT
jgi:hypothetical protein